MGSEMCIRDSEITGLEEGTNLSDLEGEFDLSNTIEVLRNEFVDTPLVDGGIIEGGPFEFTVDDGIVDNVSGVTLNGNIGEVSQWGSY